MVRPRAIARGREFDVLHKIFLTEGVEIWYYLRGVVIFEGRGEKI